MYSGFGLVGIVGLFSTVVPYASIDTALPTGLFVVCIGLGLGLGLWFICSY